MVRGNLSSIMLHLKVEVVVSHPSNLKRGAQHVLPCLEGGGGAQKVSDQ